MLSFGLSLLLCVTYPGTNLTDTVIVLSTFLSMLTLIIIIGLIATYIGYRSEVLIHDRKQWEKQAAKYIERSGGTDKTEV